MRYQAIAIVLLSARGLYCTASEAPIYTDTDQVTDSAVVGRWHDPADSVGLDSIIVARKEPGVESDRTYLVTTFDSNGVRRDEMHLTRIGGLEFADIFPLERDQRWNSIPIHGIVFAREVRDRLVLHWVDPTWLQRYGVEHPREIKIDSLGYTALFADSTSKVRGFLAKHLSAGIWSKDSILLVRMPVPGTR